MLFKVVLTLKVATSTFSKLYRVCSIVEVKLYINYRFPLRDSSKDDIISRCR